MCIFLVIVFLFVLLLLFLILLLIIVVTQFSYIYTNKADNSLEISPRYCLTLSEGHQSTFRTVLPLETYHPAGVIILLTK
jgi:hypothetical protein